MMFYGLFTIISVILLIIALACCFGLLKKFTWVLGWLRGTAGILFLGIAAMLVMANIDLMSYKHLIAEEPIATLSIEQQGEQEFTALLVYVGDNQEYEFTLNGDQWQLDARVITWNGIFRMFGMPPAYRLDRLSGRYYSLEDERQKERTVYALEQSKVPLDLWLILKDHKAIVPWIDASYGSATFLPMADDAIYRISLSRTGLTAHPVNEPAVNAVNQFY